jgi:hypothetical protein
VSGVVEEGVGLDGCSTSAPLVGRRVHNRRLEVRT